MKHFSLLLAVLLALACRAEGPPSPEERLETILQAADSDDPATRDAAGTDLERWCDETGKPAEDLLRKASRGRSPEVRERIDAAIAGIARAATDRKLLGMLEVLGMPSVKGLKYVEFNTGILQCWQDSKVCTFVTVTGWAVEISDTSITIETPDLDLRTLPRNRRYSSDWESRKDGCTNPEPKPGEFREIDFEAMVRAREKTPVEDRDALVTAAMAWWCYQRGDWKTGAELLQEALESPEGEAGGPQTDEYRIASAAAHTTKTRLIRAAHFDRARTELLESWKRVRALPENKYSDLAKTMVAGYEAQCRDDAAFRELSAEELGKLAAPDRAAYWVHLLRDVDSEHDQEHGPLGMLSAGCGDKDHRREPPAELVSLGFDAVPILIEHLDDTSPTRAVVWTSRDEEDSWFLPAVADACEVILSRITGRRFYSRQDASWFMTRDGKEASVKEAARAWWETAKNQTPEERLLDLLEHNLLQASEGLLKTCGRKHIARVAAEIRKRPDRTGDLVASLGPALGPEHADLLRAMLTAKDVETILAAADALARVAGDPSGVEEVARRLKAGGPAGADFALYLALPMIAKYARKDGIDLLATLLQPGAKNPPEDLFDYAPLFADPKVLDVLRPWFDVTELRGRGGYRPRFCDLAAEASAIMTGWPKEWILPLEIEARDAQIAELKSWLAENRDKLDWEALRKKAQEAAERR